VSEAFEYLTVDQIIWINVDQAGGTVLDRAGLEAATHRPQSDYFGVELFPDVWAKAAAYLHGLASPQYFSDGNKRTGWFAAVTFLKANGYPVPDVPIIEAETFVQAVAQEVFDSGETKPELTLAKAAEWFRTKCSQTPVAAVPGPLRHRDLEYVFLARFAVLAPGHTLQLGDGMITGLVIDPNAEFPLTTDIYVVGRWHGSQMGRINAEVVPPAGGKRVNRSKGFDDLATMPQYASTTWLPALFVIRLRPVFLKADNYKIVVRHNNSLLAELPFGLLPYGSDLPPTTALYPGAPPIA
jgi:death-on-curing protein